MEITLAFIWRWACGWLVCLILGTYLSYQAYLSYDKEFSLKCQNWNFYIWSILSIANLIFCLFANGVL